MVTSFVFKEINSHVEVQVIENRRAEEVDHTFLATFTVFFGALSTALNESGHKFFNLLFKKYVDCVVK